MAELNSREHLAGESGVISWPELQRHFARGVVLVAELPLDFLDVAMALAGDDVKITSEWMRSGRLHKATDDCARRWDENQARFRAVVVAPWVLVQELPPTESGAR
jgi:hypothetical protein